MKRNLNDEEGFTFIEALVSLLISSFVLLLLTTGIHQAHSIKSQLTAKSSRPTAESIVSQRQIEWHIFLNQLENYLTDSKNPQVASRAIRVEEWDEEKKDWLDVMYEPPKSNNSRISRFKNNGNVTMLTGVASRTFQKNGGWLLIEVTFQNNEHYQGRIWIDSWVND